MKKTTVAIGLIAALALPAGASAKPNNEDQRAAQKQCKSERGRTSATREAFKAEYRSMSRCLRRNAAEEESEREQARTNAAKECKAERALGAKAFAEKYGDNKNKKNAYGKCVSQKAQDKKAEMDDEDEEEAEEFRNAANECAAERRTMGEQGFADEYGTNRNKRNAFGRCVSGKAREGAHDA